MAQDLKAPAGVQVFAIGRTYIADEPDQVTVGFGEMKFGVHSPYAGQFVVFVNDDVVPIEGAIRDLFIGQQGTMAALTVAQNRCASEMVKIAAMVAQDYLPRKAGRLGQGGG